MLPLLHSSFQIKIKLNQEEAIESLSDCCWCWCWCTSQANLQNSNHDGECKKFQSSLLFSFPIPFGSSSLPLRVLRMILIWVSPLASRVQTIASYNSLADNSPSSPSRGWSLLASDDCGCMINKEKRCDRTREGQEEGEGRVVKVR
jgi:hypothetical protein